MSLIQKNHGLPGIGINGSMGETGEKGRSVYFGYINDFFDGTKIDLENYIYIANRVTDNYKEWESQVNDLNKYLIPSGNTSIANVLNASVYAYYYTGIIYNYDEKYSHDINTSSNLKKIGQYKVDFSNDGQLMSAMIESAKGDSVTFQYNQDVFPYKSETETNKFSNDITNISAYINGTTYNYTDIYAYEQIGNTKKLKEYEKVRIAYDDKLNMPVITYNSNDAAYIAYQNDSGSFNKQWLFDKGNIDMLYDKIMSYLDTDLEQSDSVSGEYATAVSELVRFQNTVTEKYQLLTETNLFESIFKISDISLYRYVAEGDYITDNKTPFVFDPNQYFKTTAVLNTSDKLNEDDVIDNKGYSYYAIPDMYLFQSNINGNSSVKQLNTKIFDNYSDIILNDTDYSKNLLVYHEYTDRSDISTDNGYVKYYQHDEDAYIIPTTLKECYKEGDILYFYTDSAKPTDITHMVVLSEGMLKCSKAQLLKYAQITEPFNIKYLETLNDRILNTGGTIIFKNNIADSSDKYYTHSAASIISAYTDTNLIIADNTSSYILDLTAVPVQNTSYSVVMQMDVSYLNINIDKDAKLSNLYINADKTINAEKYEYLYDSNIIMDGDFIKPITELKSFYDQNGLPYIGTYLLASDYFYNYDDLSDYMYGYDLMDGNMQTIQQRYTNADKLDLFIPVTVSDKSFYILTWASTENGIKHYSQLMYVDVDCELITYQIQVPVKQLQIVNTPISTTTTNTTSSSSKIKVVNTKNSILSDISDAFNASTGRISLSKLQHANNLVVGNPLQLNKTKNKLVAVNSNNANNTASNTQVTPAQLSKIQIVPAYNTSTVQTYNINKCDIYVQGENKQFSKICLDGIADYTLNSNLTAEKNDAVNITVNIKDDNYKLKKVLLNHTEVSTTIVNINDWTSAYSTSLSDYVLSVSSNIPGCDYINEYVHTKKELSDGDSLLFQDIVDGNKINKSDSRSILLTVGYCDAIEKYILWNTLNVISYYQLYPYSASVYNFSQDDITNKSIIYYKNFDTSNVIVTFTDNINASLLKDNYYCLDIQPGEGVDFYFKSYNYVNITAEIEYAEPYVYYENFKITQPGFNDTRDVPNITLNMHNSLIDTQTYNSIDNNVLCNQFVTYMDINVDDFKNKWGQFANNDSSILLSFHVKNILSDIDWQAENIIEDNILRHATMKFALQNYICDDSTNKQNDNYVLLHPSIIKTDNDLIYINNDESEYINPSLYDISTSIHLYNTVTEEPADVSIYNVGNKKYVLLDSSVVEYNMNPEYIYSGLHEDIDIHFKDINIDDLNDNTIHLKLLYEMGNPTISNLYLRFAVTNIDISVYTAYTKDPVGYIDPSTTLFTANVPDYITNITAYNKRLINYNSDSDYGYTFISEPLNVMINPLSYTVCPLSYESELMNMQGDVYKIGNEQQISSLFKFFNTSVYDSALLMDTDSKDIMKYYYMNWSALKVKKSYLQDNIQNIALTNINKISDIPDDNLFSMVCEQLQDTDVLEKISDDYNYMGIVYNGGIMNPKLRDGVYNFYYNNTLFDLDRYSQYGNEKPVFLNDNLTIPMRNDELFNAIQIWNKEYINSKQYDKDTTFTGVISLYGNGYSQLLESADTSQYTGILSLQETKDLNNVYIYDSLIYQSVYNEYVQDDTPENEHYYRTFLYDLNMEYCQPVSETEVKPYQIVNNFDMLLYYMSNAGKQIAKYKDKIDLLIAKNENMIPYTLLYGLYPRICGNTDKNGLNVLMLRMPTIGSDTDATFNNDTSVWSCYNLSKHYFELMSGQAITKINNNYKI